VSSSDFRQIARKGSSDRAERLFRAAIAAYCCLSHPTRAETAQLEDLALPLYASVSEDGLRYVAAALSECPAPPAALVKRLCLERVEICAPLIVRSSVLTDADLISLIARKGAAHAKVIARRKGLNPAIGALVAQIGKRAMLSDEPVAPVTSSVPYKAEETREQLRGMMAPSRATVSPGIVPIHVYPRLRAAALAEDREQLIAVLSQCLELDADTASALLRPSSVSLLVVALRALALTGEQALFIVACVAPAYFTRADAARELVSSFASESIESARKQVQQFDREDRRVSSFARDVSRAALARSA
jgi:uncharacterized protein (DUF2336 family)